MDQVSIRVQAAVYATGLFSATQTGLVAVVVPLWLLHLDAGPFVIGLAASFFVAGAVIIILLGGFIFFGRAKKIL
ncbi:MAG: hypothetical protein O7E53_03655 [Alphaproteobacteria bacterium]|nr:hypothetical protein [Alphaproteobacteria bacterium]